MKAIITITLCLISILVHPVQLSAKDDEQKETKNYAELVLKRSTHRHEKPGKVAIIYCQYTRGHLSFVIPHSIEAMQVIIGDEQIPVWEGWVTSDYPETDIPVLVGEYEITCRTTENQIFKGKVQFYY